MKRTITFRNMDHSDPLEQHAHQKLDKIEELLRQEQFETPFFIELCLTSNKPHPHHKAELRLRTANLRLEAHDEGPEMYVMLDNAVDKMVILIKKEKEKLRDKEQKQGNDKKDFIDDKYTLS